MVSNDCCNEMVTEEDDGRTLSEYMATRGTTYREDVLTNAIKVSVATFS